jgi:nitroreductase
MDFFEVIKKRRSIRSFTRDPVSDEQLRTILDAVNAAPSAGNLQAYEVVAVRDASAKKKLAKAAGEQNFIADAPVCLVFLANPKRSEPEYGSRGRELYCIQDAAIAAEHAHLSCVPLGLASVWVGAFSEGAVSKAISAPPHLRPVCILPIGHPGKPPTPGSRRALEDLVHREKVRGN